MYEIVVDPQEAESSVSDLLLQLVGTEEGITGLHVESLQKGGVPFEVVTAALSSGWQGLQEQHSKLADIKAQVSMHVAPVKCVLSRGSYQVCTVKRVAALLVMIVIALQAAAPQAAIEHAELTWCRGATISVCAFVCLSMSVCCFGSWQ